MCACVLYRLHCFLFSGIIHMLSSRPSTELSWSICKHSLPSKSRKIHTTHATHGGHHSKQIYSSYIYWLLLLFFNACLVSVMYLTFVICHFHSYFANSSFRLVCVQFLYRFSFNYRRMVMKKDSDRTKAAELVKEDAKKLSNCFLRLSHATSPKVRWKTLANWLSWQQ